MRAIIQTGLIIAFTATAAVFGVARGGDDAKPAYTIKQVMKMAHKDGLLKKVTSGKGTKEDAKQLLALYQALGENRPPKGDLADWKERTTAVVEAAQAVVDGKTGAEARLKKTVNCMACHKLHKPS